MSNILKAILAFCYPGWLISNTFDFPRINFIRYINLVNFLLTYGESNTKNNKNATIF